MYLLSFPRWLESDWLPLTVTLFDQTELLRSLMYFQFFMTKLSASTSFCFLHNFKTQALWRYLGKYLVALKELLERSGLSVNQIYAVELMGKATRVPKLHVWIIFFLLLSCFLPLKELFVFVQDRAPRFIFLSHQSAFVYHLLYTTLSQFFNNVGKHDPVIREDRLATS